MRLVDADALTEKCGDWYVEEGAEEGFIGTLGQLLSGQPETSCSEIPNNSDTISRQAAIDALKTDMASLDHIIKGMSAYDVRLDAYVSQRNQVNCDIDTISNLPPAQPERKKGRWIRNDNGTYSCSVCQSWIPEEQHYYAQYCLYCGADMRGETE